MTTSLGISAFGAIDDEALREAQMRKDAVRAGRLYPSERDA